MSLIIELLPSGRQAVRESIIGVGALVGIDAGQPSDHRSVTVAAVVSGRPRPGTKLGRRGSIAGLRPYLLSIPCTVAPGQRVAFCLLGPRLSCCVLSRNWSPDIRSDLGSP